MLLKHYRLCHGHGGQPLPCLYQDCFCSLKTWGSLRSHLKKSFSGKIFFEHLGQHLKKHETVICVFKNCNFSTNIYGTFASHRRQKHTLHSLQDFKEDLLKGYASSSNTDDYSDVDVQDGELSINDDGRDDNYVRDLPNLIENNPALLFLKLESTFNLSNRCIDEVVDE